MSRLNHKKVIPKLIGIAAIAAMGILNSGVAQAAGFTTEIQSFDLNFDFDTQGNAITTSNAGNLAGISNQWAEWGVSISANRKNNPSVSEPLLLFNSNPNSSTGGDSDLRTGSTWGTTVQNNVLIIQEDGWVQNKVGQEVRNANDPDDEAGGGSINFNFDSPVNFKEFSLLDMDDDQNSRGEYLDIFLWDKNNNKFEIDALSLVQGIQNLYPDAIDGYQQSYTQDGVTITQNSKVRGDNSLYTFNTSYIDIARVEYRYPGSGAIAGIQWDKQVTVPKEIPEPSAGLGLLLVGGLFFRSARKRQNS
ncbi:PEP-CTERM sorting domain-containing protein [Cronbergia sp. UHCC 0137]|uniref:PEP-CTERM sorting domain-containing protein n=1 Tax=Cronbergia sp. UHCC 0137 TaxID=3110239 RepID=UPI002B211D91|nr:PEP-CTERM sorting domain-containing protein [Cronbergia sp. UHCC 0137]MEA5618686.1 PEP-CTERM sorting domain-containing protein [Cronbergia sp. UHCC 0137]